MKFLMSLFVFLLLPVAIASEQGTIFLHQIDETENTVTYILEAQEIKPELIGVSLTLLLPEELIFKKHEAGTFFEEEVTDVTYLIAPKSNDPQTLVIGIVTLGQSTSQGNGIIVKLVFEKSTAWAKQIPQITEAKASGIIDDRRVDYDQILWQTESILPTTGPFSLRIILIVSALTPLVVLLYKFFFHHNFQRKTREKTIIRVSL